MVGRSFQTTGKRYFEFRFANNRASLLILYAEFTKNMYDILLHSEYTERPTLLGRRQESFVRHCFVSRVYSGSSMVGPREIFS